MSFLSIFFLFFLSNGKAANLKMIKIQNYMFELFWLNRLITDEFIFKFLLLNEKIRKTILNFISSFFFFAYINNAIYILF